MKTHRRTLLTGLVIGLVSGTLIFGGVFALASPVTAVRVNYPVIVDGVEADVEAYNIDGRTYLRLFEIGAALDVAVSWDEENRAANIDTTKPYGWTEPYRCWYDSVIDGFGENMVLLPERTCFYRMYGR